MIKNITVGVISNLDNSPALSSYYYACLNLFKNVKNVKSVNDLDSVEILLCGNDHHHIKIWKDDNFISECNIRNIPFFVHTVEHIDTPLYPWNLDIQKKLENFNVLNQRCWDIGDCKKQKRNIARVLLSKNYYDFRKPNVKKNKIVFIGKMYKNRSELINKLKNHIDIDIIERGSLPNDSYFEFISKLAEYKYVLSPKSQFVNGIPGRFYESLWVDSIPIQEINDDTLDHYNIERDINGVIFFKTVEELLLKLENNNNGQSYDFPKMFLENELIDFFKEFNVI